MPDRDAILRQIQRLLRMTTDNNASEAEATFAAERVQELLMRYNIELSELSRAEQAKGYVKQQFDLRVKQNIGWRKVLINQVTSTNMCRTIESGQRGDTVVEIIGLPHNIEVAEHLYTYLERAITRLCNAGWREKAGKASLMQAPDGDWKHPWSYAFCLAASGRIGGRLSERQAALQQSDNQIMALVVVSDGELDQAVSQYYPKLVKARKLRSGNEDGWLKGREAGDSIPLNEAVTGRSQNLKRLT